MKLAVKQKDARFEDACGMSGMSEENAGAVALALMATCKEEGSPATLIGDLVHQSWLR